MILHVARPGTAELRWLEEYNAETLAATTSTNRDDALRLTRASAQAIGNSLYQRGWYVVLRPDKETA